MGQVLVAALPLDNSRVGESIFQQREQLSSPALQGDPCPGNSFLKDVLEKHTD